MVYQSSKSWECSFFKRHAQKQTLWFWCPLSFFSKPQWGIGKGCLSSNGKLSQSRLFGIVCLIPVWISQSTVRRTAKQHKDNVFGQDIPGTSGTLVAPYRAIPQDYLSDTPRLRAVGFLVSRHGHLCAKPPPPFPSVSPLESMRSGGAISPPQKV